MYRYIFRVSYIQNYLDDAKPYSESEHPIYGPLTYARIRMSSPGMDEVCDSVPIFDGPKDVVERLRNWLTAYENNPLPPPGRIYLESPYPRAIYWALSSPKGRREWAWDLETDDLGNFDVEPEYPLVDEDGNEIVY